KISTPKPPPPRYDCRLKSIKVSQIFSYQTQQSPRLVAININHWLTEDRTTNITQLDNNSAMKLLFLLACVGLAASASLRPAGQLRAGTPRQLEYQYDAQIGSGIEEVSGQFSTVRMRFRVQMRTDGAASAVAGAEKWTVTFTEVNLRQRINATEQLPKTMLPMAEFRNLEDPLMWAQVERALKQPFAVLLRSREQKVAKVLFNEAEPFWSVNIKKGFLSMLQVDFVPKIPSAQMENGQWTKEQDEMTTAAVCRTFYTADQIEYHESDSPVYRVAKSIDFNNCRNPMDGSRGLAAMWNGLRHHESLRSASQKGRSSDLVSVSNLAQYLVEMGGDRASPLIRKGWARTVHTLSPSSDSQHGTEKIFSVQKLKLIGSDDISASDVEALESLTEQPEGLRLIYPQEARNIDREAMLNQVVRQFRKLWMTDRRSEVDMPSLEQIVRILRLHLKRVEDIEAVAQQISSQGAPVLRDFIMDICPQVANHGSTEFLMRIVRALVKTSSQPSATNIAQMAGVSIEHIPAIFAKLSMTSKWQLRTLRVVLDTVKDSEFHSKLMTAERMPIYSAAWLSLGAMVNVYYGRQAGIEPYLQPLSDAAAPWEARRIHAASSEEFRREFIAEVTAGLRRTDAGRDLALKVAKNCGLFELYDQLGPIIRSRDARKVAERVQAVYATQNMLRRNSLTRVTAEDARSVAQEEKYIREDSEYRRHFEAVSSRIHADLIACFRNAREDPELRIACYRVLMQCPNVKQTVLNMLVQAILSEPTQQVYAYCVSHMAQIASSSLPRYDRVRPTVQSVLSMLQRREPMEQVYSRVFHGQLWDELHKLGLTVETDMIVSDKSFVPRWSHIKIEHQSMGKNVPALEISMRTEGLQSVLAKLVGPRSALYADSVAKLLRRSARSLDASVDSELLDILPRMLAEVPQLDLTLAFMGYDVIYVKSVRKLSSSSSDELRKSGKAEAIVKSLASMGNILKSFGRLFSISANYELPTPAGSILDLNCFMTLDFKPAVTIEPKKSGYQVKASLPIVIKGFKRFGSNMHILNHYHQWLTTLKVLKQSSQEFVIQMDASDAKQPGLKLLMAVPGSKSPIVQFKNAAYSTFTESNIQSGRIRVSNKNVTVVHRQIQKQKRLDFSPVLSNLLAPFGYKLQVQGKQHFTADLYKAPCSLLSGPSEFTVFLEPTTEEETRRTVFISSKLKVIEDEESAKPPQVRLEVDNVRIQSDSSETIKQRLVSAVFEPRDWSASRRTFRCSLRYHLGLPSSQQASGYQMTVNGQIDLPEDLPMSPRSLPLRSDEWFNDRRLRMELRINDEESQVGKIEVQFSSNPELKKLLVDSGLSESQMKKMFPRIAACLNESRQSVREEPLKANPLFTPSCIRQFKKFNKLSQVEIEITQSADWFMNPQASPLLLAAIQKIQDYLKPYLTLSEAQRSHDANKITIVSRPSPVDFRVQHLNVTCPHRRNVWRSIQLPAVPFTWAGVVPIATSAMDYAKGGRTKCSLLHSHIKTFDDVAYSIPKSLFSRIAENQCPMLLAKDCSKAKEFQVLAHIKDGKKYITMHLNTDSSRPFVIEVSKPINSDQAKSTVKVNGVEVEHSEEPREEVQIYKHTVRAEKSPVTVEISKYRYAGTVMYRISSKQQQVSLLVGGKKLRTVEIRVSPFYRNRMCGLCGDYDSEKFREFKGPNYHRVAATEKKMIEQYVLPVSDSCRMDQSDSFEQAQSIELGQPNYRSHWSSDMPRRRSSCQIVAGKKVKTFKHAELELMSPALKQIVQDTECAAKLAVAKIGDQRVRVFLHSSRREVLVKVGSEYEQRLSMSRPASTEQTSSPAPSGVAAHLEKRASQAALRLMKDDNKVTIKVTRDQRVVIKASEVDDREDAICELSHPSQMSQADRSSESVFDSLKTFTDAEESPVCREQLRRRLNQCRVSPARVQPFHVRGESDWWQPRYMDAQLLNRLAQTQTPLILSADQIAEGSAVYSVQMVHERPAGSADNDQLIRHILLKKDRDTLAKISIPAQLGSSSAARVRVTYRRDGAERTADSSAEEDIDSDFRLSVSEQRISLAHKSRLYQLDIEPQAGKPEITIVRSSAHPSYARVGLCQANQLSEVREHHANPRAVLVGAMRATVRARGLSSMLSEAEIVRYSRLLSAIERAEDEPSSTAEALW
ncbi:hypothetical protein BOX15_Mlig008746g5, partial [Macrostomum lignano]